MKTRLLTSLLFISGVSAIYAQDTWTKSEPGGFGNPNDEFITCIQPFKGELYAGSADYTGGLYKSSTGMINSWSQVLAGPMIRKVNNVGVTAEIGRAHV